MNGGGMPSTRLCPDEDVNYKYAIDDIILSIGEERDYKEYQKRQSQLKRG